MAAVGVKNFELGQIAIPLLSVFTFANFAITGGNVGLFKNVQGNCIGMFLGIFMFIILLNYIRYPLLPTSLVGEGGSTGGFKSYYSYVNGMFIFLIVVYWTNRNNIPVTTILRMFSWIVILIVSMGFFVHITGSSIPGLESHKWAGKITAGGANAGATRLPILEQFSQIGLFLTLSGCALFKKRHLRLIVGIVFLAGVYFGGGRVALLTVICGAIVFLFLCRRFLLTGIMIGSILLVFFSIQAIHQLSSNPQLSRLTSFGSSIEETSIMRYYIYKYGWKAFMENPLFGTGYGQSMNIGLIKIRLKYKQDYFIDKELSMGGHAAHISLLKNIGLVGYIPFILLWVSPIIILLPVAMRQYPKNTIEISHSRQARFVIVYFSAMLVRMLVEGSGSELKYYVYLSLAAAIIDEILLHQKLKQKKYKIIPIAYDHGVISK